MKHFLGRVRYRQLKKILKWSFVAALVLGVGAGVWWGGNFALTKWERRQSRQLTEAAAKNLVEGRVREANMALETATRLDAENARALRLLAQVQAGQKSDAAALDTMGRLAKTGSLTLRDLVDYTSLALRQQEFELARRVADAASTGSDPALRHLLLARVAATAGKPDEAERELRAAAEVDSSGRAPLELARFLVSRGPTVETRPESLELLRRVSSRRNSLGAEALFVGLSAGSVPMLELDAWIAALRAHPAATDRHRLVADIAEVHLHPKKKREVVESAARRLRGQPLALRLEAMDWMLGLDEPRSAVELLEPAEVAKTPGIFALWLDAVDRSGDWSGALARLEQGPEPASAPLARLFEGRVFQEQGDAERAREAWEQALHEARGDRGNFLAALGFLAAYGEPDLFESGFREALAENPGQTEAVIAAVMPGVSRHRDAGALLQVLEIGAPATGASASPLLQNEIDHLALLAGRPVDAEAVAQRSREHPENFAFRATHSLALLREGHAEEAWQVLQDCKPDVHMATLPRRQKAVAVAALAANGFEREARFHAATLPPSLLLEQEVRLISGHLEKKTASAPRIPNSAARARPKPKLVEDLPPLPEGTPDPTKRAIAEALQEADSNSAPTGDATRQILFEARMEAEKAAAAEVTE